MKARNNIDALFDILNDMYEAGILDEYPLIKMEFERIKQEIHEQQK